MSVEIASEFAMNDLEKDFSQQILVHDLYVGQLVTAKTVACPDTLLCNENVSTETPSLLHVTGKITSIATPEHNQGDTIVVVQPDGNRTVPAVFLTSPRTLLLAGQLINAETIFEPYPAA